VPRIPALLIGLALAAFTLRPQVVGIGPLLPAIQTDYGVSHAVAGLLVTIPVLCMGLFAPPAPILAHRIGAVRAVTVAVALVAFGGVLRAFAPSAGALIALTIPIGIGMGLGNALMVVAVKERFASRPLLVTGVYAASIQVGSTIAAATAVPLSDAGDDWRLAPLVFGAGAIVSLLAWAWASHGLAPPDDEASMPHYPLRSSTAWLIVLLFVFIGQIYYGLTAWLPDAYQEKGWSESDTGLLTSVMNLATVPAALLVSVAGHRLHRRTALVAAAVLMLVCTTLLLVAPDGALVWVIGAGWANGTLFTLAMTLPLDVADSPGAVGGLAGMMLGVGYIGIALAPITLGAIRDATGSFEPVLGVIAATSLALLVVAWACSPARLRRGLTREARAV
jgi:CP family cyanate transporter-like MFS transporter